MPPRKRPTPDSTPPELAALLRAVCDSPHDDAPRLVAADWLDEHGSPADLARAELIRLQCALSHLGPDDPTRPDLELREQRLIARHQAAWTRDLPAWLLKEDLRFRRGFVADVSATADRFLKSAAELSALVPIEALTLRRAAAHVPALAASAVLSQLRTLRLPRNVLRTEQIRALASSSLSTSLVELDLRHNHVDAGAALVLARSPLLSRLTSLNLERSLYGWASLRPLLEGKKPLSLVALAVGSNSIGPGGAAALGRAPTLPHLADLDLNFCQIDDSAAEALAASPLLPRLRSLNLQSNEIGPDGATALARGHRLAHLNLAYNQLTDDGVAALAAAPSAIHLTSLDLTCNDDITAQSAAALADSHHLANLTRLNISYSRMGDGAAVALLRSEHLARLSHLDLGHASLGPEDARALAKTPGLARLTSLSLAGNFDLPGAGLAALLRSRHLTRLTALDLMHVPIGDEGMATLLDCPSLPRLASLALVGCRLTAAGATHLLASPHLDDVAVLDLRRNQIPAQTAAALRERFGTRVRLEGRG
jgi:uncharacterized protein (TIGR02996 family)